MEIQGSFLLKDNIITGLYKQDQVHHIFQNKESVTSPTFGEDAVILPSFIDLHVHCRENSTGNWSEKEDYRSASLAALSGGVGMMLDMPNHPDPTTSLEAYQRQEALIKTSSLIPIIPYGLILPDTEPFSNKIPYKIYMAGSVGDMGFHNNNEIDETLKNYAGHVITFHAEDPELLETYKSKPTHEEKRHRDCEIKAVANAIDLSAKYNIICNIAHLSTQEALNLVKSAKKAGQRVTCEATPHHFLFDTETEFFNTYARWLQVNPPIRLKKDKDALIEGLQDGSVDFIATDHAPHTLSDKKHGTSGIPHLDTYGDVLMYCFYHFRLSWKRLLELSVLNPLRFISSFSNDFNLFDSSDIASWKSLCVLSMDGRSDSIDPTHFQSKSKWSPLAFYKDFVNDTYLKRYVIGTIVNGKFFDAATGRFSELPM